MRRYMPADRRKGPTPSEIHQWFGDVTEKVLVFHNLYGRFAKLPTDTVVTNGQTDWPTKFLVECFYRQANCKRAPRRPDSAVRRSKAKVKKVKVKVKKKTRK